MMAIKLTVSLCALAGIGVIGGGLTQEDRPDVEKVSVGVFDSRALAVAYARSNLHKQFLGDLRAKLVASKGDRHKAQEIETLGQTLQARMHKQGFSTAPVDDILKRVASDIPLVAKKAGVDVIVSKWRLAFQRSDVKLVDVTDELVMLFAPDESTLKIIAEMKSKRPLPLYETDWKAMEKH